MLERIACFLVLLIVLIAKMEERVATQSRGKHARALQITLEQIAKTPIFVKVLLAKTREFAQIQSTISLVIAQEQDIRDEPAKLVDLSLDRKEEEKRGGKNQKKT